MSPLWILDIRSVVDKRMFCGLVVAVVVANKKDRRNGNRETLLEIQSDTINSVHSNIHSYLYTV